MAGGWVMTVRDRVRGALVETLAAIVMLARGIALRTQTGGFLALLGLLLVLMAAMALAHAVLFAAGTITEPGPRREPLQRVRDRRPLTTRERNRSGHGARMAQRPAETTRRGRLLRGGGRQRRSATAARAHGSPRPAERFAGKRPAPRR